MTTPEFDTLSSDAPIVIGHRGASGSRPEHTLASYQFAIEHGADFIEPDLVATRDGFLIARHENVLAAVQLDEDGKIVFDDDGKPVVTQETTNVAEYDSNGDGAADFADRLTVKSIDGDLIGGWFSEDFTLAEIKELSARERIPDVRPDNTDFNDQFEIPTLGEVIQLVKDAEADTGRVIGIYPETKHPTFFAYEGTYQNEDANGNGLLDEGEDINQNGQLDVVNGGAPIDISLGTELIHTLVNTGFTDPERIFIQSFEIANLLELQNEIMPAAGVNIPLVQLYGDVTDAFINDNGGGFSVPYDVPFNFSGVDGANPDAYADLGIDIDADSTYATLNTPEALQALSDAYAEGAGPWKDNFILRVSLDEPVDGNNDGVAELTTQLTGEIVPFIDWAHDAGVQVHPYTLRNEEQFLTVEADGTPQTPEEEFRQLIELGADGFFTDYPGTGSVVVGSLLPVVPSIEPTDEDMSLLG